MTPLPAGYAAHVPPPDPEFFWSFEPGQSHTFGINPDLGFRVDAIFPSRRTALSEIPGSALNDGCTEMRTIAKIQGTQFMDDREIKGELLMDCPVVICRSGNDGEPLVTLTLRKIEDGKAFLQVTARMDLRRGTRQ